MDIKKFIKKPEVKSLKGNAFKFLLELYSMTDNGGVVEDFTITSFVEKAKQDDLGFCTGRNTLARFIDEFVEKNILDHDRYKKQIKFK